MAIAAYIEASPERIAGRFEAGAFGFGGRGTRCPWGAEMGPLRAEGATRGAPATSPSIYGIPSEAAAAAVGGAAGGVVGGGLDGVVDGVDSAMDGVTDGVMDGARMASAFTCNALLVLPTGCGAKLEAGARAAAARR